MFLSVQNKPSLTPDFSNLVTVVPNMITVDMAKEIKDFATNTKISGWHRRGSKHNVKAGFYTCLLFRYDNSIYEILDSAWEKYIKDTNVRLNFLEPYEVKQYIEGDGFGYHNDIQVSMDCTEERKINLLIQLSDENDYVGGDLYIGSKIYPKTFGTGIFFPAKYPHCVSEVIQGNRFSLIGHAWGPI